MKLNPYESPRPLDEPANAKVSTDRDKAAIGVRIALAIMLFPALYNFMCFNFVAVSTPSFPIQNIHRILNALGFFAIVVFVWFCFVHLLELITLVLNLLFGRKTDLPEWNHELYQAARTLPLFAIPGAVLWAAWVACFYQLQIGFFKISWPIGIASNLLAATIYLPLLWRWYRINQRAPSSQSAE